MGRGAALRISQLRVVGEVQVLRVEMMRGETVGLVTRGEMMRGEMKIAEKKSRWSEKTNNSN